MKNSDRGNSVNHQYRMCAQCEYMKYMPYEWPCKTCQGDDMYLRRKTREQK